jgi:predicted transposase YbfD/YdcC
VIAIDGKTLRGSAPRATPEQVAAAARGGGRTHLVAGCDHASGVTLGQVACSAEAGKGGEVAAAMTLAAALDVRGLLDEAVITVDAGFTARELAADLRERGAHWILRVKGNQKTLHTRLTALPWSDVPEAARVRSVGHGGVETRTIRVIDLSGSSDGHGEFFPDARQAIKVIRRRRDRHGRWSVQTVYAITSLVAHAADPALLATWVRGHWSIEAGLHWVRDVTLAEDHSQIRTANGPQNLAALRTLALNALRLTGHTNIAAGLRKHARTPFLPLVTLGLA